jgi:hypothetical protein
MAIWSRIDMMRRTLMSRQFLIIGVFLLLWNFNPFSSTIQQLHLTDHVRLTPQQYRDARWQQVDSILTERKNAAKPRA